MYYYGFNRETVIQQIYDRRKYAMPKIKTKRAAAKRFKKTGTGKLVRNKAFKSHILTKKSTKRKRNLRKDIVADQTNVKNMTRRGYGRSRNTSGERGAIMMSARTSSFGYLCRKRLSLSPGIRENRTHHCGRFLILLVTAGLPIENYREYCESGNLL